MIDGLWLQLWWWYWRTASVVVMMVYCNSDTYQDALDAPEYVGWYLLCGQK
jgi:uncharacterized membrane protein (DUF106 family)